MDWYKSSDNILASYIDQEMRDRLRTLLSVDDLIYDILCKQDYFNTNSS